MKKTMLVTAVTGIFAAAVSFASDHSHMHETMMKEGGHKSDTRIELKMAESMKAMHKSIMRGHLDALGKITAALAANELEKAAKIAKGNLGWNESEEKMCSIFGESAGEAGKDFLTVGKAMHTKADELSADAMAGNRDKALADLSPLIESCNICHEKFRH
ncbi:MAG: cytochrome c [Nitrospinae bacterium]|nr:cytochrome c [Nitrospinota bacterium]